MPPAPQYLRLTDPSRPEQPRRIAYYEWTGDSRKNAAICVHGFSRNGRDFDFVARALSATHRVLCPDMAGHGKSDWLHNKADYNPLTYIADTLGLLDRLELECVDWVGTSIGGFVGMMLAAQHPKRIRRLVLNDCGAVGSAVGLKRIRKDLGTSRTFADAEDAMAYLKSIYAPAGVTSPLHWQHLLDISFVALPGGGYSLAYDPGIRRQPADSATTEPVDLDVTSVWNAVACPVLILRGEESDILSYATAQAMLKRTAATELVEIPGVGHAPALLESAQIGIITQWLAT